MLLFFFKKIVNQKFYKISLNQFEKYKALLKSAMFEIPPEYYDDPEDLTPYFDVYNLFHFLLIIQKVT